MNFCWQGHGEFLFLPAFLSHSFLEPMHFCIRNFGCHNVLICLNYLVQGIVKTIEITSESMEMAFSGLMLNFARLKFTILYPSVFTHFFFFLDKYTFAIRTYIPMNHICLDCRGLEELFHKKRNMAFYCHGSHESLMFQTFQFCW